MERMRRIRAEISQHDSAWRFAGSSASTCSSATRASPGPTRSPSTGRTLRFARAVIATGARPGHPPIPGLAEAGYLTNETVFELTERPGRLAVIGGGPIGCELAQAFRRLGAEVTLLSDAPQLLPREDPDAAEIVRQALLRDGVRLVLGAAIAGVAREGTRKVLRLPRQAAGGRRRRPTRSWSAPGARRTSRGSGSRRPACATTREGVVVDDHLRTTNPRIYAAGDVCLGWKFTHAADAAARIVVQNALFGWPAGAG